VRTGNEIATLLKADFKPVEVLAAFNTLQKAGFIGEAANALQNKSHAFGHKCWSVLASLNGIFVLSPKIDSMLI
jgi:hypothetical protein